MTKKPYYRSRKTKPVILTWSFGFGPITDPHDGHVYQNAVTQSELHLTAGVMATACGLRVGQHWHVAILSDSAITCEDCKSAFQNDAHGISTDD